jgi:hypothetical protein
MAPPGSSNSNHQQAPTAAAAAAALQRQSNGSADSRQVPASSVPGTTITGSRKRPSSSQQVATGAVGREDAATWAAVVGHVRRHWPGFSQHLEGLLMKVRIGIRSNGVLQAVAGVCM